MREITIGIDIGTSSVKAVAADEHGNVVRAARVPHAFSVPTPTRFEHDAAVTWWDGPRAALAALDVADLAPCGLSVAAMVPSLGPVGADGRPVGPGLLYGDDRGAGGVGNPAESGELGRFLAWLAARYPDARGYWPAQAVANCALSGRPVLSTTAAAPAYPLFDFRGWDAGLVEGAGARVDQMPELVPGGRAAGTVEGLPDCVIEGGTIDAMGEQIVAGADEVGDVLVICGTTLITWCVVGEPVQVPGSFPIPHTTPDRFLIGGPSNAGGLFLNWAKGLFGASDEDVTPDDLPVWVPYPRGERVPINDNDRRAQVVDLNLRHGPAHLRRAAHEAAGFVARRIIEASPVPARRIVATGGGVRVREWLRCLADCTGLPVDVVGVAEGGALGAAWLGRMAAGLETSLADARRWATTAERVEPDPAWQAACERRYQRFLDVAS